MKWAAENLWLSFLVRFELLDLAPDQLVFFPPHCQLEGVALVINVDVVHEGGPQLLVPSQRPPDVEAVRLLL